MRSVEAIEPDKTLRYAMLFHDIGKAETKTTDEEGIDHFHGHVQLSAKMASDICHRLKFDNKTLASVKQLIAYHDVKLELKHKCVRRMMNKLGSEGFGDLLKVKQADLSAQSLYKREEKQAELDKLRELYMEILKDNDCVKISDLAVNGKDLMERGITEGPLIGKTLAGLLERVMDEPKLNTREKLLELIDEKDMQNNTIA